MTCVRLVAVLVYARTCFAVFAVRYFASFIHILFRVSFSKMIYSELVSLFSF
jgi:hypothetical protein